MSMWIATAVWTRVTAACCRMLRTGKRLCCTLQGRRSAVMRLEACSSDSSKGAAGKRLPEPWSALLGQLTAAAQTRMRLDALAAEAACFSNGDPLLQVCQGHGPTVLKLPSWQTGCRRHWQQAHCLLPMQSDGVSALRCIPYPQPRSK